MTFNQLDYIYIYTKLNIASFPGPPLLHLPALWNKRHKVTILPQYIHFM